MSHNKIPKEDCGTCNWCHKITMPNAVHIPTQTRGICKIQLANEDGTFDAKDGITKTGSAELGNLLMAVRNEIIQLAYGSSNGNPAQLLMNYNDGTLAFLQAFINTMEEEKLRIFTSLFRKYTEQ